MKIRKISFRLIIIFLYLPGLSFSQNNLSYQLPPDEIVEIVDAKPTPGVSLSPGNKYIAILEQPNLQLIEDIARQELRLGGIRIDPKSNGPSRLSYYINIKVKDLEGKIEYLIKNLPENSKITNFQWSPDGEKFCFTLTTNNGIELWKADIENLQAVKLTDAILNNTFRGMAYVWLPDGKTILYKSVLENRGDPPKDKDVPEGPVIQENIKGKAALRTYQDLLKSPYDEILFEYYASSQLVKLVLDEGSVEFGLPGIFTDFTSSPDGQYVLIQKLEKPFSYLVPYYRFPVSVEIWDNNGKKIHQLAEIPLTEDIPKGFDAVRKGPRSFRWRSDVPATIYWVTAMDEGDPEINTEIRDQVYYLQAPFNGEPIKSITTNLRFSGLTWGNNKLAVVREYWRKSRQTKVSLFDPVQPEDSKKIIFDYSSEDRYNNPGNFAVTQNDYGRYVLLTADNGKSLYLMGQGASPEGNRPFIDKYFLKTGETDRLWRSEAPYYERTIEIINEKKGIVLTSRQSKTDPPNYYLRNLKNGKITQITDFPHPYPQLQGIEKQLIKYEREDGVKLSFELYLPPGYNKDKDGPLPTLLWAYPREYKSADAAGQIAGSPYSFIRISPSSALVFITQGYALLNNTSFPIIGEEDEEPNNTFVEQLVANAEAAINKAIEMGVTNRSRVAVSGHSYGAFMTANLLAHSDLFAAGIARSGAYNRTLTPFGFQAEPRTYWEAPEIYYQMSPFMHADKVKAPILLIHGMADNNSGTFPIQSERFYSALKGHGATVRLVMLPYESHGYNARESILHMQWEMLQWLDKFVKHRK
jgi:dipeptidyl aminopeptidase/acylaminoacyl peptidase